MKRFLAVLLTLVAAGTAPAQPQKPSIIRLSVAPAKAPVPALKYHLLPDVGARKPGNAALLYYRSFSPEWLTHRRPEVSKKLDKLELKPGMVPPAEFRWVLTSKSLQEVDRAARRSYCEWELLPRLRKEGIALLLPDLQTFRSYAQLLALRARYQIQDGKHEAVAATLQTGFSLARDVANAPTLIQALVGNAIATVTLEGLEEWIQKPGAPNLYWALTDLPRPFIDLRKPLQGERLFIDSFFPGIREVLASKRVISPSEVGKLLEHLAGMARDLQLHFSEVQGRLALAALAVRAYPEARRVLLARGWTKEQLKAMPVLQAFILHEILGYDASFDDMLKWNGVPYWKARAGLAETVKRLKAQRASRRAGGLMAALLLPAIEKVQQSSVRLDRRIAALRCVEALRLYAAAHNGKLPAALTDVTEVPLPLDPLTGKSFEYRRADGKATLIGPVPANDKPNRSNYIGYEITLKK